MAGAPRLGRDGIEGRGGCWGPFGGSCTATASPQPLSTSSTLRRDCSGGEVLLEGRSLLDRSFPSLLPFLAQDGISVKALSEQGGRISNKKPRKAGNSGSLLYGRFVKVTGPRSLGAAWPPAHCCCGPQSPVFLVPLSHSPSVCVLQSATLTACGEESVTLPASSESSEEEEKLDLSSVRR